MMQKWSCSSLVESSCQLVISHSHPPASKSHTCVQFMSNETRHSGWISWVVFQHAANNRLYMSALCRCIYTTVTQTHFCQTSMECVCPAACFSGVLWICNEAECLTRKDYGHTFLPLCASQVLHKANNASRLNSAHRKSHFWSPKWILPDKDMISGVEHDTKTAYLSLPLFPYFHNGDEAVCELMSFS